MIEAAKKIALRTPEARFSQLPDYPFTPHYLTVSHPAYDSVRLHYVDENRVDEGSTDGAVILLLHGCPTWSFLYRKVINRLLQANPALRVIAPDWPGCGKSDKLLERSDYRYDDYVRWLREFVTALDLRKITLVAQDWGGPIGLRVVSEMPERFARVLLSNTLLPNAEAAPRGVEPWPGQQIQQWVNYCAQAQMLAVGRIVQGSCVKPLAADVIAAYDAPFPDAAYQQGMLNWPTLIPLTPEAPGIAENRKAWEFLERSTLPVFTAFSDSDPSTAAWETIFHQRARGASHTPALRIQQAGHMVQEDAGEALADIILGITDQG